MRLIEALAASAAFGLSFAVVIAPAEATTMKATYTGILTQFEDYQNTFGAGIGQGLLIGENIIASFYFDTDGATTQSSNTPYPRAWQETYGGSIYDPDRPMPVLAATIKINGHTEVLTGGEYFGLARNFQLGGEAPNDRSTAEHNFAAALIPNGYLQGIPVSEAAANGTAAHNVIPLDLNTPFVTDLVLGAGGWRKFIYTVDSNGHYTVTGVTTGQFNTTHLEVTVADSIPGDTTAVPLPASLPLLVSGVLGLGWLGRRKPASV